MKLQEMDEVLTPKFCISRQNMRKEQMSGQMNPKVNLSRNCSYWSFCKSPTSSSPNLVDGFDKCIVLRNVVSTTEHKPCGVRSLAIGGYGTTK